MTRKLITLRGETYLSLETIATCYQVEIRWVEEVYRHGLLGPGERLESTTVVTASSLERVARILQLERQQGLDLARIALLLDTVL